MADSSVLSAVLKELRAALEADPAHAEKPEERFRIMRPFEKALADLSQPPSLATSADRAGKVATLLWQKAHPDKANLDVLLAHLGDDDTWVRATAATVLASLQSQGDPDRDKRALYRTRVVLERQRYREPSQAIAFQLEQLIEEIEGMVQSHVSAVPAAKIAPRNPYVVGPPLRDGRMFFGRDDVLGSLRRALGEGDGTRSIVIQGGRRTGKTSLLYRIRDGALGEAFLPVYFDMQATAGKPLAAMLGALADAVSHAAAGHETGGTTEFPSPAADFDRLRESVKHAIASRAGRKLLLMFDEYEVFTDYLGDGVVARQLQSLLEHEQALIFLFAGAQKIDTLKASHFRRLLDDSIHMKISFLSESDAKRLVTEPAHGMIEFPDPVADDIVRLTAGHPFYVQALCQVIFDEVQHTRRGRVEPADVEHAVVRFVENPAPHLVLGWNSLPLDQKVAASALAMLQDGPEAWVTADALVRMLSARQYPIRIARSEMRQALGALREEDWVIKQERGHDRAFRLTMELVRRWIVDHRSIWDLVREQRTALMGRTAPLGRRAWAALIDLMAIGVLTGLTLSLAGLSFFAIALLYPVAFVGMVGASPGMLIMRVKVLSETGTRLSPWRSIMLGSLAATPLLLLGLAASLVFTSWGGALTLFVVSVSIVTLHAFMVHFSRKKRGLFDKLVGAVFVVHERE
jgi:uncharacterized RDD family membrane protein YckC